MKFIEAKMTKFISFGKMTINNQQKGIRQNMKKSLKEYGEQYAPRKNASKLLPFFDSMVELREQGYSYAQLSEALFQKNVKAYPSEIKRFLDRRLKKVVNSILEVEMK